MSRLQRSERTKQAQQKLLGIGTEPRFNQLFPLSNIEIARSLNWYAFGATCQESKKWAVEWAKDNLSDKQFRDLNSVSHQWFTNQGFILRMVERGAIIEDLIIERVKNQLIGLIDRHASKQSVSYAPRARVVQTINPAILIFEEHVDECLKSKSFVTVDSLDKIKSLDIKLLEELKELVLQRFLDFVKNEDCHLKDSVQALHQCFSFWQNFINDQRINTNKPKVRRRKKVSNKVCTFYDKLEIRGYPWERLEGKTKAVLFNIKTEKLCVLTSEKGFKVDRNYIDGITTAVQKKIKEPNKKFASLRNKLIPLNTALSIYSASQYVERKGFEKLGLDIMILSLSKSRN